jgi:hypothetical protein
MFLITDSENCYLRRVPERKIMGSIPRRAVRRFRASQAMHLPRALREYCECGVPLFDRGLDISVCAGSSTLLNSLTPSARTSHQSLMTVRRCRRVPYAAVWSSSSFVALAGIRLNVARNASIRRINSWRSKFSVRSFHHSPGRPAGTKSNFVSSAMTSGRP